MNAWRFRGCQNTFIELGYNHQDNATKADQTAGDSIRIKGDPNQTLANGQPNPFAGRLLLEGNTRQWMFEDRSDNLRLMASTELDYGRWGNYRLAALAEHEWRVRKSFHRMEVWGGATAVPAGRGVLIRRRTAASRHSSSPPMTSSSGAFEIKV